MEQVTVSVRMDKDIKRRFEAFCADAGMNVTVAFNMFARAVLREQRIPFEITGNPDPFYSRSNMERLQESIEDFREGRVIEKTMEELEAMEDA